MKLYITFHPQKLDIALPHSPLSVDFQQSVIRDGSSLEPYEGEYIVTPMPGTEQILSTNGKRMTDNVTVLEIPYYETSNLSGGYTAIIGG